MALVEGGTFVLGTDEGREREKHGGSMTVEGYCLDLTEVTVAAYRRCVDEKHCTADKVGTTDKPGTKPANSDGCNLGAEGRDNYPINCVDWTQAKKYCEASARRLPTEVEWEYAARGGSEDRLYPWTDLKSQDLCFNQDTSCPVGSHPGSDARWGHHDMAGNVWEWTDSLYCDYPLPSKHCQAKHVIRGGGFNMSDWSNMRGANRNAGATTDRGAGLGFRCAAAVLSPKTR